MRKGFYPRQEINLTERPEWSEYDMAGMLGNLAAEQGWQMVSDMDCDTMSDLAEDVLSHGVRKKKWKIIGDEEQRAICEAFKRGPGLEAFRQLVSDAAVWSVEAAYMPTKSDLQDALENAIEIHSRGIDLGDYETLQRVVGDGSDYSFLSALLGNATIEIQHEDGMYDRTLIYDPFDNEYARNLVRHPPMSEPQGRGVLDWMPSEALVIPNAEVKTDLTRLFAELKEPLVKILFSDLKQYMEDIDVSNRIDFYKQWKNMLEDGLEVKVAQKELKGFLKTVKKGP